MIQNFLLNLLLIGVPLGLCNFLGFYFALRLNDRRRRLAKKDATVEGLTQTMTEMKEILEGRNRATGMANIGR